ncbi:pyruvate synthase [candidate division WOR-3 bacterium JGI_Cruoil_03_51_56]|uniref:Pyruvate synthase n=1 Tax=candidate division WOR-3 bacterium JGI_Cruoil_03_51_56 TaxID=1973747 RepID=A0A235BX49_UNCW3|nr:MAG: pyruvate synthase [candidate division WOR-3 bacterium JGI_Cruoil_03_51_56]
MSEVLEIRWHGRGGQGAKTAALLFAGAALDTGKYIQAFPEYGPERMGAPVTAFNRLSKDEIHIHSGIKSPDIVVVLDPSLIEPARVTQGLKDNGILLVNTTENPQDLKKRLGLGTKVRVYTVDASRIAIETVGKDVPNAPLLGALVKITGILKFDPMMDSIKKKLTVKFRGRENLVESNLASVRRAYGEVKG